MKIVVVLIVLAILIASIIAEKCPEDSEGIYPKCVCLNREVKYNGIYNWCVIRLLFYSGIVFGK